MEQLEPLTLDRFPLGIQNFEDLRKRNAFYVDKTDYVYKLVKSTTKTYFLARPRRFGKSLFCNTLRAYFEGKKDLFDGLKIYNLEKDWTKYPVLYFDFVSGDYTTGSPMLIDKIKIALSYFEKENNIQFDDSFIQKELKTEIDTKEPNVKKESKNLSLRLEYDLRAVYDKTGLSTAILVDEYDNPLVNSVDLDTDKAIFRGFFSVLKSADQYIKFAFFTITSKIKSTKF